VPLEQWLKAVLSRAARSWKSTRSSTLSVSSGWTWPAGRLTADPSEEEGAAPILCHWVRHRRRVAQGRVPASRLSPSAHRVRRRVGSPVRS
jgi:hypothetical protein